MRDTQRQPLLQDLLVAAAENLEEDRHDVSDGREGVFGDVAAAIGGSRDGSALRARGKEIQVGQAGRQAALANDARWKFGRDLFQGLHDLARSTRIGVPTAESSLLRKINVVNSSSSFWQRMGTAPP